MKKLGVLRIQNRLILSNEELLMLKGGEEDEECFYCTCGTCEGFYGACTPVWAHNISEALQIYSQYCGSQGVTCMGDGCPQWYC